MKSKEEKATLGFWSNGAFFELEDAAFGWRALQQGAAYLDS